MTGKYDGIIGLPHHVSSVHPQMPRSARAAQFSPFAALTGYGDAIEETARLTEGIPELTDDEKDLLNRRLAMLSAHPDDHTEVTLVWYRDDERKSGGTRMVSSGAVKKIDASGSRLIFMDGTEVPLDRIVSIEGE